MALSRRGFLLLLLPWTAWGGGHRVAPPSATRLVADQTLSSTFPNATFGRQLTALDLDGDGDDELLVTSPNRSNPQANEGAVSLFLGSPAGLSGVAAVDREGNTPFLSLGLSMTSLDADGDGNPDLVVGSSTDLWAFYGTGAGFGGPGWTTAAPSGFANDGIADAGDLDGDGLHDLVVGEPYHQAGGGQQFEGRARVFFGSPAGLSPVSGWSWEPNLAQAHAGTDVAGAGDVDGDGFDDLLVSGPGTGSSAGTVWLFYGGPGGPGANPGWSASGSWETALGTTVAGLGDVNGDGYDDFAAGAPGTDLGGQYGTTSIWFGGPAGPAASADQVLRPEPWLQSVGYVGAVGDLDGDGLADMVVQNNDPSGYGYVYYGDSTGLVGPVATYSGGYYGYSPVGGDLNGDGYSDFAVARMWDDEVDVYYGAPDRDGDGTPDAEDCEPDQVVAHPGAPEIYYDGIDGDCLGGDDFDRDHDGHPSAEYGGDDCDDAEAAWFKCLVVSGTCPGALQVLAGGATPNGGVRFVGGARTGSSRLASGSCAGTEVGVEGGLVFHTSTADASGTAVWSVPASPAGACGAYVAAVDLTTCETYAAGQVP